MKKIIHIIFLLTLSFNLYAEDQNITSEELSAKTKILNRITVAGTEEDKVPGSAYFLDKEELDNEKNGFDDIHKVLRRVPGVNIQEEDGFGLRPNIGFRGTSVERSSNITLMEDSVLIAPAPYSAPSAYYFPSIGRMESLEVLKGAGQIKYGPRSVGGSLNMFSTSIPDDFKASIKAQAGEYNSRQTHVILGDSYKNAGWMLESYQNQSDGFKTLENGGDTGFDVRDYVGKFKINSSPDAERYQELEFKFNVYDQDSNETYLGLTQEDFDSNPYQRYIGSELDNIDVEHEQLQLRHFIELGDKTDLTTTVYKNDTKRNWFKTDSVNGNSISSILGNPTMYSEELAWIKGADSDEGAFALRHNKRSYESEGIQTALGHKFETENTEHDLEFGVRYHEDEEDRFQHEDSYTMQGRSLVLSEEGAPGSNANRVSSAQAWSFYVQDEIAIDDLTITPGLRYEKISLNRKDYGKVDPMRLGTELSSVTNKVDVFIPGVGLHQKLNDEIALFAGVHKGFSPPTPSSNNDVREEESINYELGANYNKGSFFVEVLGFLNDYDNLLGADTLSSGGEGTGDLFNGGTATVWGSEVALAYNFSNLLDSDFSIPFRTSYTFTNAEFDDSFDSDFFGLVSSGDMLPYIPENQLSFSIGLEGDKWATSLGAHFNDSMATVAGQAGAVSTDKTDSYFVFDLNGEVEVASKVKLFATIQNLFDDKYVVARRPAGARPGLPRTFFAGVKVDL